VVQDIRASGHVTLRAIAGELNRRGMLTRRDGQRQVSNVQNLLSQSRLDLISLRDDSLGLAL